MIVRFHKYQATGNDFIMLNAFASDIHLSIEQIQLLCDRHFGIGSDGLIILRPDRQSDFFMDFYNPDGTMAGFCGNGGRCSVLFARDLGLIGGKTLFRARDGQHHATLINHNIVKLGMRDVCQLIDHGEEIYVNTGTHHVVVFVNDIEKIDIISMARPLRYGRRYAPEGTNVNFVQVLDEGKIKVRTYEKGVEQETLSCGTGVVASALVTAWKRGFASPLSVQARGGQLKVYFERINTCFEKIYLQGSVRHLFIGEIDI